ncbi:Mitochondrial inner membrane protease subunit 2 [Vanrija pseudolonga]|uniref:Mitochondrial inner membrane protease subunit n=1 Tax=Vanrija pseudolonga TaxID=143232 RepID=A0AAF0Y270_9TREE|nr:Mitochondrial inner membrane protease subunit 2 [Vanrija pseudolonga]
MSQSRFPPFAQVRNAWRTKRTQWTTSSSREQHAPFMRRSASSFWRASAAGRATSSFLNDPTVQFVSGVLAWIPVGMFVGRHVYSVSRITGRSMLPTFNEDHDQTGWDDVVLLDRWSWSWGRWALQRGDVVTLWSPREAENLTTKRIVALEGDIVTPRDPKTRMRRTNDPLPDLSPYRIPPGHVWVEGDNAGESVDSNTYGPVAIGLIQARVTSILFPFDRFGPPKPAAKNDGRVKVWDDYVKRNNRRWREPVEEAPAAEGTQGAARPT